ncbi:MAG: histidine phosphatase family protein, partial [Candidatus Omnitrophota bacterium]
SELNVGDVISRRQAFNRMLARMEELAAANPRIRQMMTELDLMIKANEVHVQKILENLGEYQTHWASRSAARLSKVAAPITSAVAAGARLSFDASEGLRFFEAGGRDFVIAGEVRLGSKVKALRAVETATGRMVAIKTELGLNEAEFCASCDWKNKKNLLPYEVVEGDTGKVLISDWISPISNWEDEQAEWQGISFDVNQNEALDLPGFLNAVLPRINENRRTDYTRVYLKYLIASLEALREVVTADGNFPGYYLNDCFTQNLWISGEKDEDGDYLIKMGDFGEAIPKMNSKHYLIRRRIDELLEFMIKEKYLGPLSGQTEQQILQVFNFAEIPQRAFLINVSFKDSEESIDQKIAEKIGQLKKILADSRTQPQVAKYDAGARAAHATEAERTAKISTFRMHVRPASSIGEEFAKRIIRMTDVAIDYQVLVYDGTVGERKPLHFMNLIKDENNIVPPSRVRVFVRSATLPQNIVDAIARFVVYLFENYQQSGLGNIRPDFSGRANKRLKVLTRIIKENESGTTASGARVAILKKFVQAGNGLVWHLKHLSREIYGWTQRLQLYRLGFESVDRAKGTFGYGPRFKKPLQSCALYIFAHGVTQNNVERVFHGSRTDDDNSLPNEEGQEQVRLGAQQWWTQFGEEFMAHPEAFVFVQSPLRRTRRSFEIFQETIAGHLRDGGRAELITKLAAEVDPGAREIDFGSKDGLVMDQLNAYEQALAERHRGGDALARFAGTGENFFEFIARVSRFRKKMDRRYAGKKVFVFGHGSFQVAAMIEAQAPQVLVASDGHINWRGMYGVIKAKRGQALLVNGSRLTEADFGVWSETREQELAKELHRDFKRVAIGLMVHYYWQFLVERSEASQNIKEIFRSQSLDNVGFYEDIHELYVAFYRYGRDSSWWMPEAQDPATAQPRSAKTKKNFDRYDALLKRYRAMTAWALRGRFGENSSLTLYRGDSYRHPEAVYGTFLGSNGFATESKEVAIWYTKYLPPRRFLILRDVPYSAVAGYWRLYPEFIGYPRNQREYNLTASLVPEAGIQAIDLQGNHNDLVDPLPEVSMSERDTAGARLSANRTQAEIILDSHGLNAQNAMIDQIRRGALIEDSALADDNIFYANLPTGYRLKKDQHKPSVKVYRHRNGASGARKIAFIDGDFEYGITALVPADLGIDLVTSRIDNCAPLIMRLWDPQGRAHILLTHVWRERQYLQVSDIINWLKELQMTPLEVTYSPMEDNRDKKAEARLQSLIPAGVTIPVRDLGKDWAMASAAVTDRGWAIRRSPTPSHWGALWKPKSGARMATEVIAKSTAVMKCAMHAQPADFFLENIFHLEQSQNFEMDYIVYDQAGNALGERRPMYVLNLAGEKSRIVPGCKVEIIVKSSVYDDEMVSAIAQHAARILGLIETRGFAQITDESRGKTIVESKRFYKFLISKGFYLGPLDEKARFGARLAEPVIWSKSFADRMRDALEEIKDFRRMVHRERRLRTADDNLILFGAQFVHYVSRYADLLRDCLKDGQVPSDFADNFNAGVWDSLSSVLADVAGKLRAGKPVLRDPAFDQNLAQWVYAAAVESGANGQFEPEHASDIDELLWQINIVRYRTAALAVGAGARMAAKDRWKAKRRESYRQSQETRDLFVGISNTLSDLLTREQALRGY